MTEKGKPLDDLGDLAEANYKLYLDMKEQRDELLEAVKALNEGIRHIDGLLPKEMRQPYLQLRNAIAKAEAKP